MSSSFPGFILGPAAPLESGQHPRSLSVSPAIVSSSNLSVFSVGFTDGSFSRFSRSLASPSTLEPIAGETDRIVVLNSPIYGIEPLPSTHPFYSQDCRFICGGGDQSAHYMTTNGSVLASLLGHTGPVESISFPRDANNTVISGGWDGYVRFWAGTSCLLSLASLNKFTTYTLPIHLTQSENAQMADDNTSDGPCDMLYCASASGALMAFQVDYPSLYAAVSQQQQQQQQEQQQLLDQPQLIEDVSSLLGGSQTLSEQFALQHNILQMRRTKPEAHAGPIRSIIPVYNPIEWNQLAIESVGQSPEQYEESVAKLNPIAIASMGNDGYCRFWSCHSLESLGEIKVLETPGEQTEFVYHAIQLPHAAGLLLAFACDDKSIRVINVAKVLQFDFGDAATATATATTTTIPPSLSAASIQLPIAIHTGYHHEAEIAAIALPAPPRRLQLLPHGDIAAVCNLGVFTFVNVSNDTTQAVAQRCLNQQQADTYNQLVQEQFKKKKGGQDQQEIDVSTLPKRSALFQPGDKPGQVKVVNIDSKAMAVKWNENALTWDIIGETVGSNTQNVNKIQFEGNFYDKVVDVDLGGGKLLQLPFNVDDDPYDVAQAFVARHYLSKDATKQIVDFIFPYIDKKKLQRRKEQEALQQQRQITTFSTTNWNYYVASKNTVDTICKVIPNRMIELIQKQQISALWPSLQQRIASGQQISSAQDINLQNCPEFARLAYILRQTTAVIPEDTLRPNDIDVLLGPLLQWPDELFTPVIDIFRLLALEERSNALLFNPVSKTLHAQTFILIQQRLFTTLSLCMNAAQPQDKRSFASISLWFDVQCNIIAKLSRSDASTPQMVDYLLKQFLPRVIAAHNQSHNVTLQDFIIHHETRLLPNYIRFFGNVMSLCNRMRNESLASSRQAIINLSIQQIASMLVSFPHQQFSALFIGPNPSEGFLLLLQIAQMVVYEANSNTIITEWFNSTYRSVIDNLLLPILHRVQQQQDATVINARLSRHQLTNFRDVLHDVLILFENN